MKQINKFLKPIDFSGRKHYLFDFDAIWKDSCPIFLLISERGRKGKTVGAKKLARDIWENEKLKTVHLWNLDRQIKKEIKNFLFYPNIIFPNDFSNVGKDRTGLFTYNIKQILQKDGTTKNKITDKDYYDYFMNLAGAEKDKGSRMGIGLMIYEEFNVGTSDLRGDQTELLNNLVSTFSNVVDIEHDTYKKLLIMGNFKSLNSKLLIDLGITKIDNELTIIKDQYGKPLITILCPTPTKKEIEEIKDSYKNNWQYQFAHQTNQENHIFYNENLYDFINSVYEYSASELEEKFRLSYIFYYKKSYLKVYISPTGLWHVAYSAYYNGEMEVKSLTKNSLKEGTSQLNNRAKKQLARLVEIEKITFQNVYSRGLFIDGLIKS